MFTRKQRNTTIIGKGRGKRATCCNYSRSYKPCVHVYCYAYENVQSPALDFRGFVKLWKSALKIQPERPFCSKYGGGIGANGACSAAQWTILS